MLKKIKAHHIILAIILLWGAFLRLYHLGSQSIWMDESYTALAVERIADSGVPILKSGASYWRALTYTYPAAGFQILMGKEAWVLRLPAALFGIASILLTYWAGIVFFKKRSVGLAAAFFAAFSLFQIAWSRQIRMYTELQFLFLFCVTYFYYLTTVPSPKARQWAILFFATLLTLFTNLLGVFLLPAYVIILFAQKKKNHHVWRIAFAISGFAISTGLLTNWGSFLSFAGDIFTKPHFYIPNYLSFLGMTQPFLILTAIFGLIMALIKKNRPAITLSLIFAVIFLAIGLSPVIAMRYIFFLMPLLFLTAGYGIVVFLEGKKFILRVVSLLLVFAITFRMNFVLLPQSNYFLEYDPLSSRPKLDYTPQPDFKKAYDFLKGLEVEGNIYLVAHTGVHEWYRPQTNFYWLSFPFGSDAKKVRYAVVDNEGYFVERYTGAPVIDDADALEEVMADNHGFVIWDYFSTDDHLPRPMISAVKKRSKLIFEDIANPNLPWTQMQIYQF